MSINIVILNSYIILDTKGMHLPVPRTRERDFAVTDGGNQKSSVRNNEQMQNKSEQRKLRADVLYGRKKLMDTTGSEETPLLKAFLKVLHESPWRWSSHEMPGTGVAK